VKEVITRMNVRKIRSSKALKLLGLLLSSLFIATVSAAMYNYMYIQGSGVASTAKGLKWELGAAGEYPSGTTIDGFTVTNLNFSVAGSPVNYTDCLHIVNQDTTESHLFNLRVMNSYGAGWSDFTEFNLVVFDALPPPDGAGVQQAVLDLSTLNDQTADMTLPASTTWYILFEIVPISSPTNTPVYFEIELVYESSA
jgi:hypothetical protein